LASQILVGSLGIAHHNSSVWNGGDRVVGQEAPPSAW